MVNLKIPPERAILLLNERVGEIERLMRSGQVSEYYILVGWCSKIWSTIDEIYGVDSHHPEEIRNIGVPSCSCCESVEAQRMLLDVYHSRLLDYIDEISEDG
jgi:hypothetical protein